MPYLILGVALFVGLLLLARGVSGADPRVLVKTLKWTAAILAVAVAGYLTVTGRIGIATMIAAGMIPLILRARQIGRLAQSFRGPSPGQSSDVETAYLRMRLDHDSGTLHGTVLEGTFRGRHLDELNLGELMVLLQECRVNDAQSATVLESYLDRVHGTAWRAGAEDSHTRGEAGTGGHGRSQGGSWGGGQRPQTMTAEEAYEILGLGPGASAEEVRDAHRRLMLKIHPDQGGSTYLATKINQAKELLLGG